MTLLQSAPLPLGYRAVRAEGRSKAGRILQAARPFRPSGIYSFRSRKHDHAREWKHMSIEPSFFKRAKLWAAGDPDPETARELQKLIEQNDTAALAERFSGPLQFGTAGLRGILGAGESRMNLAVIATTTAALCDVLEQKVPEAKQRGLIV